MTQKTIEIDCDVSELKHVLSEVKVYLSYVPAEIVDLFFDICKGPGKLFSIEQSTASRTETLLVFKPAKRLLDFMSAVRAGDFERLIVERRFTHKFPHFRGSIPPRCKIND